MEYSELMRQMKQVYKEKRWKPKCEDAKVLNMICKSSGYDVVKAAFSQKENKAYKRIEEFTRIFRCHVQLCVRNNDCINWSSLKVWDGAKNEILQYQ